MKRLILAALFLSGPSWAFSPCTTLSTQGFTQDQINLTLALSYEIGFKLDNTTQPPTVTQAAGSETICFNNPSFDPSIAITTTTLVTQYQTDQTARNAAAAQIVAWQTELSTTTAVVISGYNNFGSLTQAQINQGTKNIVRILWLRQLLGIDPS